MARPPPCGGGASQRAPCGARRHPPGELDVRIDEAKDEVSGRLAEVHASLAEMEAESGPARAAALLAGETSSRLQRLHRSSNCEQVSDLARRIKAGQQGPSPVVGGARNSLV
jgi:hypothetical protein